MGLLDMNFDDPATMGLLSAGLNMIGNSGRGSNMGTAQILAQGIGSGIEGYQGTKNNKRLLAKADMDAQFEQMRMDGLKQQQEQHALTMQRQAGLQEVMNQYNQQSQQNPQQQAIEQMGSNLSPTNANADTLNQIKQSLPASPNQPNSEYERRLGLAKALRAGGYGSEGDAEALNALKFQKKIKDNQEILVDGKVYSRPVFEDGTYGQAMPEALAKKLHFSSQGDKYVGQNDYTGAVASSNVIGQSADSKASNALGWANNGLARERLVHEKSKDGQPVWNNEVGAFISPPTAQNPSGQKIELAGYTKPDKPLNDSQSKALLFGTRMQESHKILGTLAGEGTNVSIPGSTAPIIGGAINALSSDNQQMLGQSKRDFMNAVLRRESGAAISSGEFVSADKQYFPQVGDSPKVIAQKSANRELAIKGVLSEVPEKQRASITPKQEMKPQKTIVKTGLYGGKKVVQYSDGTTDYAN